MIEELKSEMKASKASGGESSVRYDTPDQRSDRLSHAMSVVNVLRPRSTLPATARDRLTTMSLSELSRVALDCYNFPWSGDPAQWVTFHGPAFVSDIPERADFAATARMLLLRRTGFAPQAPEQNGLLVAGPVGCGKTTLTYLLTLAFAAMNEKFVLIHFDCRGDMRSFLFSQIVAAGLAKAGVVSKQEAADALPHLTVLEELAKKKGVDVALFVDEAQRMFMPENALILLPGYGSPRADFIESEVDTLQRSWPKTFLSGSASSLEKLFYTPQAASSIMFPSKISKAANQTKLLQTSISRIRDTSSLVVVLSDLERDVQLSRLALAAPELERDPVTLLPLQFSDRNREWLKRTTEDLSDRGSQCPLEDRNRVRAVEYLRRYLGTEIEDERMLLFAALLFSRGVPRVLKELSRKKEKPILSLQALFPAAVRSFWSAMAGYILAQPNRTLQEKLKEYTRDLSLLTYPSETISTLAEREDVALIKMDAALLRASNPSLAQAFPTRDTLVEWVDQGFIEWDESTQTISFASFTDFVLTRLNASMRLRHVELLALMFNALGHEHERIAIAAIREAAKTRFLEPRVRAVLQRIGVVPADGAAEAVDVCPLWETMELSFPSIQELRVLMERSGYDSHFASGLSTIRLLLEEATSHCHSLVSEALEPSSAAKTHRSEAHICADLSRIPEGSTLHRFATLSRRGTRTRTVHEAFDLEPNRCSYLLTPTPDHFKVDWILVNPDSSISLIQVKHGKTAVSEEGSVLELLAGRLVLRAWLGFQGVPNWATTPIRPVVWSVRPTVESEYRKRTRKPPRSIASKVGVEWLDKKTIAPVWPAEVVQLLFNLYKEELWGVESERERAGVSVRDTLTVASLLLRPESSTPVVEGALDVASPSPAAKEDIEQSSTPSPARKRRKRSDAGKKRGKRKEPE